MSSKKVNYQPLYIRRIKQAVRHAIKKVNYQPLYIIRIKQAVRHAIKKGKLSTSVYNTHQSDSPSSSQKR